MLIVSPATATAFAPHASDQAWLMFVQVNPPTGGAGPIKIEAVVGKQLASRLRAIAADNPFETMLIGLVASDAPLELGNQIAVQFPDSHLHDGWFETTPQLLGLVQAIGQASLQTLLAHTSAGNLSGNPVDITEMAKILDVSISTIRRLVRGNEIPYLRSGRMLRFVPADVIATLRCAR